MTVLDDAGAVVDRWAFRHTEQDLAGALERLAQLPRRQAAIGPAGQAALGPTAPVGIPATTLAERIGAQVQLLRTLLATIAELQAAIAKRVAVHPRAKLLAWLPDLGTINLAQLLAEEIFAVLRQIDDRTLTTAA